MTKALLNYINEALTNANINYEFGEWTSDVVYPYFVGEYTEPPPSTESNLSEPTFILNGFARNNENKSAYLLLEESREIIERLFTSHTLILPNGNGVSVEYAGALIVPTDGDIKRLQINLQIQEWRVF